jgi:hypothetical protein
MHLALKGNRVVLVLGKAKAGDLGNCLAEFLHYRVIADGRINPEWFGAGGRGGRMGDIEEKIVQGSTSTSCCSSCSAGRRCNHCHDEDEDEDTSVSLDCITRVEQSSRQEKSNSRNSWMERKKVNHSINPALQNCCRAKEPSEIVTVQ